MKNNKLILNIIISFLLTFCFISIVYYSLNKTEKYEIILIKGKVYMVYEDFELKTYDYFKFKVDEVLTDNDIINNFFINTTHMINDKDNTYRLGDYVYKKVKIPKNIKNGNNNSK